jgi:Peptidase family S41
MRPEVDNNPPCMLSVLSMIRVIKYLSIATIALAVTAAIITLCIVHTAPSYFDLIVMPRDWKRPLPVDISRSDALHDWAALERIIRTGYAGYDYFRVQGKDWNALFAEGQTAIVGKNEIFPACDFMQIIQQLFNQVEDRHLWSDPRPTSCPKIRPRGIPHPFAADLWFRPGDGLFVDDNLSPPSVAHGAQLLDCPGLDLEKDLHFAAIKKEDKWHFGRRIIYLSETSKQSISCRFRRPDGAEEFVQIAVNRLSNDRTNAKPKKLFSVEMGETTYLRLGSFSRNRKKKIKFLMDLPRLAPEVNPSRVIVVDLQGNGGGVSMFFNRWTESLKANRSEVRALVELKSETASQGAINGVMEAISIPNWDLARGVLPRANYNFWILVKNAVVRRGASFSEFVTKRIVYTGRAKKPFIGDMMLIVDEKCASACESAVLTGRRTFDAVVIGTNTKGIWNFSCLLPYRLPTSGIQLLVPVFRNILDGENFRENRGFLPDVWMDLRDGGAMARDFASAFADPTFRAEVMPLIREAGERNRDLSLY